MKIMRLETEGNFRTELRRIGRKTILSRERSETFTQFLQEILVKILNQINQKIAFLQLFE